MSLINPTSITSNTVDGSINGSISIFLGIVITAVNFAEIIVLGCKGRKRKKPEHIILSLSCADLMVGFFYTVFGISNILHEQDPNSSTMATVKREIRLILVFTIIESLAHIFAIAVERLYSVKSPFRYRILITNKRMLIIIACVWVTSVTVVAFSSLDWWGSKRLLLERVLGWLIIANEVVIVCVYGYLAYFLSNRFHLTFSRMNVEGQTLSKNLYSYQKRETIFCIGIAAAFIFCSLLAAIGLLLKRKVDLFSTIGEYLLIINSLVNPVLYFWKSYLSRKKQVISKVCQRN